jgi:hypothetical protein
MRAAWHVCHNWSLTFSNGTNDARVACGELHLRGRLSSACLGNDVITEDSTRDWLGIPRAGISH